MAGQKRAEIRAGIRLHAVLEEIDLERARQAKERAESNIGSIDKSDESYLITEAKLKRALARIQASS